MFAEWQILQYKYVLKFHVAAILYIMAGSASLNEYIADS